MRNEAYTQEVGVVTRAKGYLISLEGLPHARIDDVLIDEDGNRALVTSLNSEHVNALSLDRTEAKPGERFSRSADRTFFSFGEHLFGRVINALGEPLDGSRELPSPNTPLALDVVAQGVSAREHIREQFCTGVTLVDTLLPIGKGQRQLIFGTIRSGKTTFLKDVVMNQKNRDTICIYAAIGKPLDAITRITSDILGENGSPHTIILAALSNEPSPLISIAPSVAFSLAEHFSEKGNDVLLILDDLGTHAKYLREIALLEGRLPGRESYPGDVFYQHAHLMERSGRYNETAGGGSITLLPVLETDIQNTTDLIPTNLMASTDGHFSFSAALRAEGVYPSILEEESVTRVGRNTQSLLQKQLATRVMALLADYRSQQEYSRFGADLNEETKKLLHQGALLKEFLQQEPYSNIPVTAQAILLGLTFTSFLLERDFEFLRTNKQVIGKTAKDSEALSETRDMVLTETPFEDFIEHLNKKLSVFEDVCRS